MLGSKARHSLAQYLELQEVSFVVSLMSKHSMPISIEDGSLLTNVIEALNSANDQKVLSLLEEVARTSDDLRARVSQKFRHTDRYSDLCRCLQLVGYFIEGKKITQTDPSIGDAPPMEDDLLSALANEDLPEKEEIVIKINASSDAFRSAPPNFNACLNDVRVALETLVRSIAAQRKTDSSPPYDQSKWGSIISFLRQIDFLTAEEEKGLIGVYGFVSPGSHRPLGISEEQMARLGRSLALSMCWFLLKSHRSGH